MYRLKRDCDTTVLISLLTWMVEGVGSEWSIFNKLSYSKWPFWASTRRRLRMVHFQATFLLKMTIMSLLEAQAPNGQFSSNFLIENDNSEPPRGAGSEWSISNQVSYWKWPFWASTRRRLRMVHFQATFLLKITILSLLEAQAPNGPFWATVLFLEDLHWILI